MKKCSEAKSSQLRKELHFSKIYINKIRGQMLSKFYIQLKLNDS